MSVNIFTVISRALRLNECRTKLTSAAY